MSYEPRASRIFLNANDHEYPTKRVRRPQGPKAISMNSFVVVLIISDNLRAIYGNSC